MKFLHHIKTNFLEEAGRWVLWLPVLFALGVVVYFQLPYEPTPLSAYLPAVIIFPFLFIRRMAAKYILLALFLIAFGFAAAKFRAEMVQAPVLDTNKEPVTLSGNIEVIDYAEKATKLTLTNLRMDDFAPEQIPKKIRLTVRTKIKGDIKPGDRVITDAVLAKPPEPALPGGYDFARSAYFKQIGATGFTVRKVIKLKWGHENNFIDDIRYNMTERIWAGIADPQSAAVSAALITGERSKISDETNESMRDSGLSHLLSISGLHLTLVVGVIFFVVRSALAFGTISDRISTKKLAAAIAIFGGFFYLLLSGVPVPAVRSFLMISLILIAVILDRAATPIRSVAFAALGVLIIVPESAVSPSFQMSFMAVAALIAAYEFYAKKFAQSAYEKGDSPKFWLYKFLAFPVGIVATSIIAGVATAPFSVFHFNQFSAYGMLSNLLAIPITSFLVMPAAVAAALFMPLGWEALPLKIMGWGVDLIILISAKTSALEGASYNVPTIPDSALALMTVGMLWLIIWEKKWRLWGLVPMLAALFITQPLPDILVSGNGKLFAINNNGTLYLSKTRETFLASSWVKSFGQEEFLGLPYQDDYEVKGKTFSLNHPADITFTPQYLATHGTTAVYINNGNISLQNVADTSGDRLW